MSRILPLLAIAGLGACAPVQPVARTAKAEAHLQQVLSGRIPGPPISCLSDFRSGNMVIIDDNTVLFRDGRTVYRNDFRGGGCSRLGSGFYALLTRRYGGSGLCRGDIAEVKDMSSGATVGSCAMGDFIPYSKPRG